MDVDELRGPGRAARAAPGAAHHPLRAAAVAAAAGRRALRAPTPRSAPDGGRADAGPSPTHRLGGPRPTSAELDGASADLLRSMLATVVGPGRRGHDGRRPQDRRRRPGRDDRGLPGVPALPVACRKLTIFGSARTLPDDPVYVLARDLAAATWPSAGWMVVTGAGPGIMAAGLEGAGRERSLRRQHPAAPRAGGQPVHRPGPEAGRDALLLHPQAHAHQGVPRLRRAARAASAPRTSASSC